MNKRYKDIIDKLIYKNEKTPFSIGTIALSAFCLLLLIISTFTQIEILHPWFMKNSTGGIELIIKSYLYVAQIPVLMWIISVLGKKFSFFVVLIYIITGLFIWPVFSFGGGVGYLKTGFFGYIFGFLLACIFTGNVLNKGKHIKTVSLAIIIGILTIYVSGLIYTLLLAIFKAVSFSALSIAIKSFELGHLVYDFLCSLLMVYIGFGCKYLLWPMIYTDFKSKKIENVKKSIKSKINHKITKEKDEFDIDFSKKPTKKRTKKQTTKNIKEKEQTKTKNSQKAAKKTKQTKTKRPESNN